jgi:putative spermidine/putrescine transport system permease protein
MARYANPRVKALLYLSITLPLWSSYLVKVYAWKLILAKEGILSWVINQLHLASILDWLLGLPSIGGPSLSISPIGIFLVFVYVWLPYMVLPIQAALERVPKSLLEASEDLGAKPQRTFRHVILPLVIPGVIAGSIFTFSLTLGDFIVPTIMGNSSYYIGQAVLSHQGTSGNIPLAAAMTSVPMLIMAAYLVLARKIGAFDAI